MTTRSDYERLALLVHEVRSPTAALVAIAAVSTDSSLGDDAMTDLIGLVLAACRAIERIVNDATPSSLHFEDVDVSSIARAAVAGAALGGGRVRATLAISPLLVRADPIRLRQALDNIIGNALVHSPAGADVVVAAKAIGGNVLISVQDSGSGIAAEHHERIFEPGVRLQSDVPGSGLGLPVARAIAEAHGGTLSVRSTPGAGATFVLVLVRKEDA